MLKQNGMQKKFNSIGL